jgi:hypothetical protein
MARVGARRPCSEWGRDIDSVDGDDVDAIMKAVPGWDRLFYPVYWFSTRAFMAKIQSGQPGKRSQPGCGTA